MLDLTVKNWGFEGHISVFVDQRLGFEIHHLRFDTYNSALEGGGEWQFGQDLGLKAHIIGLRRAFWCLGIVIWELGVRIWDKRIKIWGFRFQILGLETETLWGLRLNIFGP